MALLSVILRELRLEARRLANYWLRVLAPAVMVFCFAGLVVRSKPGAPMPGAWLFADFHSALLIAVWLVAPLLTADCLAQEKREGTLQLLLLTRLSSSGIVAAKTLVHALRGFAVLLAALPILCLPFLLGGVSPAETIISAQLTFSMLMLGLGGGVLSSALTRSSTRATSLRSHLVLYRRCC